MSSLLVHIFYPWYLSNNPSLWLLQNYCKKVHQTMIVIVTFKLFESFNPVCFLKFKQYRID